MNHTFSILMSTAFSLFLLMDAIGNVPIFLALLKPIPPKRQRVIIMRELFIALVIILLFALAGQQILSLFGITPATVMLSGGIILFMISIKMIFPPAATLETPPPTHEPFLVPLALPLVAGPAVLAAVILYSSQHESVWITMGAILIAWVASAIILLCGASLRKFLGKSGTQACERLMGLILTMIAVEMFSNGISSFAETCMAAI